MSVAVEHAAALFVAVACTAGCAPSTEDRERADIAVKIDALRAIPVEDVSARARAADELARAPITTPDAIVARDLCAKAFGAFAEGMRLASVAEAGVKASSSADARATLEAARDAKALLDGIDGALDRCADASAALRVRH